jgi:hypothetical protein
MLDPATGEPDPGKLQTALGTTPLEVSLPPGDYLVVAVLDDLRFHEVIRHVPAKGESMAFAGANRFWSRDDQNRVTWYEISIPRADITLAMGFVEGVDAWVSPVDVPGDRGNARKIGSFYFDLAEVPGERREDTQYGMRYDKLVRTLEAAGTRPPSLIELVYLQAAFLGTGSSVPPASVRLPSGKTVQGLFEPPFEWTSSKGPTASHNGVVPVESRWMGAGEPDLTDSQAQSRIPHRLLPESFDRITPSGGLVTGRGVRSHRPRTRPEDF